MVAVREWARNGVTNPRPVNYGVTPSRLAKDARAATQLLPGSFVLPKMKLRSAYGV